MPFSGTVFVRNSLVAQCGPTHVELSSCRTPIDFVVSNKTTPGWLASFGSNSETEGQKCLQNAMKADLGHNNEGM